MTQSAPGRLVYDINLVLHPERDHDYVSFADAARIPFQPRAASIPMENVWWLAEASLAAYWPVPAGTTRFQRGGLRTQFLHSTHGTDCYVAWNDTAVIVAFRGTEPDKWDDLLTDGELLALGVPADDLPGLVSLGVQLAWRAIQPTLEPILKELLDGHRGLWWTGHSLGGALAIRGGASYPKTTGVVTFGCPMMADRTFEFTVDKQMPIVRVVAGLDQIPTLPHTRGFVQIGSTVTVPGSGSAFFGPLVDHMPKGYAVRIRERLALDNRV